MRLTLGLVCLGLLLVLVSAASSHKANQLSSRVERSAEAGRQNPSENRERRVRRKKGGNDNSQRRQQRRRQQRRKKWRKGNGKKGRRQQRPDKRKNCACARQNSSTPSDDCLATALKYQIAVSAFLANLKRSENRMKAQNKTGSGKAEKKGIFSGLVSKLIDAGGGNKSDMSCGGAKNTPGSKQLTNLTTILKECKENINKSCSPANIPQPNMTKIEACNALGKTLSDGVKECKGKTGSDACTCFTNETLKTTFDELKKCDYKNESDAIKTAFKSCKSAFGSCRKYEDDVLTSVVSCSKSPDAQKQDAKALSENTDAVKAAQAKIKALTTRRRRSASSRIASCTELTTEVKTLTVYISENPKSTKIKVLATTISTTTVTCSDAEKAALKAESDSLDSAATELEAALDSAMKDLETATGTTPSASDLAAVSTTADPAGVTTTLMNTTTTSMAPPTTTMAPTTTTMAPTTTTMAPTTTTMAPTTTTMAPTTTTTMAPTTTTTTTTSTTTTSSTTTTTTTTTSTVASSSAASG